MADINISNLDDNIVRKLQLRAKENGHSVEAEIRKILIDTVLGQDRLGDFATRVFSPTYEADDDEFELPERETSEPITFDSPIILASRMDRSIRIDH